MAIFFPILITKLLTWRNKKGKYVCKNPLIFYGLGQKNSKWGLNPCDVVFKFELFLLFLTISQQILDIFFQWRHEKLKKKSSITTLK